MKPTLIKKEFDHYFFHIIKIKPIMLTHRGACAIHIKREWTEDKKYLKSKMYLMIITEKHKESYLIIDRESDACFQKIKDHYPELLDNIKFIGLLN